MGHCLFVNHKRKWAFVEVARAGNTTLKTLISQENFPGVSYSHELLVHRFITHAKHDLCVPTGSRLQGYRRFAVWRDPIPRCVSLWKLACYANVPQYLGPWVKPLFHCDFGIFAKWVEGHMRKPRIDIHVRRQCSLYRPEDVDDIVPLEFLDQYLQESFGYEKVQHRNVSIASPPIRSQAQSYALISRLYAEDYAIPFWGKTWTPRSKGYTSST